MEAVKVNYSQFMPDALIEVLKMKYDLPAESECIFFKNGLNDLYKITSAQGTFFLRVSLCGEHTTEQIKEEIEFIEHLRSLGLSVVEPIALRDNSYVWEISAPEGSRQAVMFKGIEQRPTGEGAVRMRKLGALIARLHNASLSFKTESVRPPIDIKMLVDEPTRLLTPYLERRADDMDFLSKTARALWDRAETMLSRLEGAAGYCHGDIQTGNFFFNGEEAVIFDFDCMGKGYFAYDLGVLLMNLTFMDEKIDKSPIWKAVIKGYEEERRFTDEEEDSVYIFAALHMLRALSYHAKLSKQNIGAFYYMSDPHLDTYFGAYRRLVALAQKRTGIKL